MDRATIRSSSRPCTLIRRSQHSFRHAVSRYVSDDSRSRRPRCPWATASSLLRSCNLFSLPQRHRYSFESRPAPATAPARLSASSSKPLRLLVLSLSQSRLEHALASPRFAFAKRTPREPRGVSPRVHTTHEFSLAIAIINLYWVQGDRFPSRSQRNGQTLRLKVADQWVLTIPGKQTKLA